LSPPKHSLSFLFCPHVREPQPFSSFCFEFSESGSDFGRARPPSQLLSSLHILSTELVLLFPSFCKTRPLTFRRIPLSLYFAEAGLPIFPSVSLFLTTTDLQAFHLPCLFLDPLVLSRSQNFPLMLFLPCSTFFGGEDEFF